MSNYDEENNDMQSSTQSLTSSSQLIKDIIKETIAYLNEITSSSAPQSEQESIMQLSTFIEKYNIDITTIIDPEKNSIAQILANDNNIQGTFFIIKTYHKSLTNLSKFNQWLLNENISKETIFEYAVENLSRDVLKFLGPYITSDMTTKMLSNRTNVFHYAAKCNNIYALLFFYDIFYKKFRIGNCINTTMSKNMRPIHLACYSGNSQTVDAIIDLGADIDAIDENEATPLHYAVSVSNIKITKKLVIYGANKALKNKQGQTAYDIAVRIKQPDLCEVLATKNVFEKMFKCAIEYKTLKNRRKDYLLAIVLILVLLLQISCYFFIREGSQDDAYCILSQDCLGEFSLFIVAMICEVMAFIMIFLFTSLQKKPDQHEHQKSIENLEALNNPYRSDSEVNININVNVNPNQQSLSELYETNEDMCIRCRKNKSETTVHCIACDNCIELWDHHCFWLNCCISAENKTWFNLFLMIIFMTTLINAVNFVIYFLIMVLLDTKQLLADILYIDVNNPLVLIVYIIIIIFICIVLVMLLYVFLSVIVPFSRDALYARRQRRKKIQDEESQQQSRTALITE